MIVVDTNILAYFYLPGDFTAAAEALLQHESHWCAPILWRSEFRNILTGYMRRGDLAPELALDIQGEAESLLSGAEYEVGSGDVLRLTQSSSCSAYDCEFVALAMTLLVPLVTMDRKILEAFPDVAKALPHPG